MLQLIVLDIHDIFNQISKIIGFDIKFEPIKSEPWGKDIYGGLRESFSILHNSMIKLLFELTLSLISDFNT